MLLITIAVKQPFPPCSEAELINERDSWRFVFETAAQSIDEVIAYLINGFEPR
jgi:hypothetical protein